MKAIFVDLYINKDLVRKNKWRCPDCMRLFIHDELPKGAYVNIIRCPLCMKTLAIFR